MFQPTSTATEPEQERRARMEALSARVRERLAAKAAEPPPVASGPAPRHDQVYWCGVAWLDSL